MKNRDKWQPSKYIYRKGRLVASRDPKEVGVSSRLIVDLIAKAYDESIRRNAKGKLLDLGCGKVPFFMVYRDYVADNICVDWENTKHKNVYLDFECDLTKNLPLKDGEFDTIILSDVLEHIPSPEHLCKEISRVLSTNGRLMMNVPFYYHLHERPHDYYRYTEYALRRFIENSGLKLLQIDSLGGVPEILADILAKSFQRIPVIGESFAIFIQWSTLLFIRTRFGRKISEGTKRNFPLGYFLIAEKRDRREG